MGRLVLIRHCETESNVLGVVQGRKDLPLSSRGLRQTKMVCEYVNRSYSIDRVISSDLSRCVETARGINAPLSTSPLLRELDFGEWEGQKWSDIRIRSPELIRQLLMAAPDFMAPGGESYLSFTKRIERMIREENLRRSCETIAVVTHDGALRSLITSVLNWPVAALSDTTVFVGSVSSIIIGDNIPRLDLLNYHDHLAPSYAAATESDQSK